MKTLDVYSYKLDKGILALDYVGDEPVLDTKAMTYTGVVATTDRDRIGDIVEVDGIDFSNHRKNPIVLLDHGLSYKLPIAKTEDENGNYKVWASGSKCYYTAYFSQHSEMANQVFHLINEKILRASSLGYRAIDQTPIRTKSGTRGMHIKKCELLECSVVGLPCNQDAVTACYHQDRISGKPMLAEIKSLLKPYIITKNTFNGADVKDIKMVDDEVKEVMPEETKCPTCGKCGYQEDAKEMDNQEDGNESVDPNPVKDEEKNFKVDVVWLKDQVLKILADVKMETKTLVIAEEETYTKEELATLAALERKIARQVAILNR